MSISKMEKDAVTVAGKQVKFPPKSKIEKDAVTVASKQVKSLQKNPACGRQRIS